MPVTKPGVKTKPKPRPKKKGKGDGGKSTNLQVKGVSENQARFVILVTAGTKLSPKVIAAWVLAEGGPDDNPLNIGPGNHYGSVEGGAKATVSLLHTSLYKGVLASAGKSDTEQIHAIAQSPWCPNCPGYEALLLGTLARVSVTGWNGQAGLDSLTGWQSGADAFKPNVDNPLGGLDGIAQALQDIVKFLVRIVSPEFLQRVGKIILGALALIVGAVLLARAALGVDASMTDTVRRRARSARAEREYAKGTQRQAERAYTVGAARRGAKNPRPKPSRVKTPKPGVKPGNKVSPSTPLSKTLSDEPPF